MEDKDGDFENQLKEEHREAEEDEEDEPPCVAGEQKAIQKESPLCVESDGAAAPFADSPKP
eukprot:2210707-Prymnesium_polylepis.2